MRDLVRRHGPNEIRSPRLHELYKNLELDPSIHGYLDWVTGIVQVNCTVEEYFAGMDSGDFPDVFLEALLHEGHHALQLATFGYLYRFAFTMHFVLSESMPDHVETHDQLADAVRRIENETLYQNIVKDLYRKGSGGLAVLDLVEGLTYCVQHRERFDYDTDAYLSFLRKSHVPPEYESAFFFFYERAGKACDAVKLFPIACHLSLCSHSPPECFELLTEAFARGELTELTFAPQMIEWCRANDPDYRGFSWEFPDAFGNVFPDHARFGKLRRFFLDHPQGGDLFTRYLLKPETIPKDVLVGVAIDTVLFNPKPDPHHPEYREWPTIIFGKGGTEGSRDDAEAAVLMSALSRKLMGTVSVPM